MRNKTTHAKILSLILALVMALSTAMVFAEVDDPAPSSVDSETVTEENGDEAIDETVDTEDPANSTENEENVEEVSVKVNSSATVKVGETVELKAEASDTNATFSWSSSDESVATVDSSGMVKGVKAGTAIITVIAKTENSEAEGSCKVTVQADFTNVKPVLSSKKKYGSKDYEGAKDNGYILSWTQSDKTGVTGYQILCDGKVVVKDIKATESSREVLVPSGSHNYLVKAIGSNNKSIQSATKKITVSGVITSTHPYKWYCTTKKKVKTGGVTIPKGTKLEAVGRYPAKIKKFKNPKKVQVVYKNKKVWVPYKSLKGGVKASVNVKQDYSRSLKEQMVNGKNFKEALKGKAIVSKDDTLIWACLYTQRAYTFKKQGGKWVLKHTDRITTGKFSHPTRSSETSGIYTVRKKTSGKVWMVQENGKRYYFTNASYITSGISFHTGTWWASGKTRGTVKANGQPGTYGCIRMYTGGAKYIFSNTKVNKTAVIVTRFN